MPCGNKASSARQWSTAARALELQPDFAKAHNNLGNALRDLGQLDDSEAAYRRALKLDPTFVEASTPTWPPWRGTWET